MGIEAELFVGFFNHLVCYPEYQSVWEQHTSGGDHVGENIGDLLGIVASSALSLER